jgi:hypothetical protein
MTVDGLNCIYPLISGCALPDPEAINLISSLFTSESCLQYALAGFAEYERGPGEGDALYAKSAAQGNSWAQCRLGSLAEGDILSGEVRQGKTAAEVSVLVLALFIL